MTGWCKRDIIPPGYRTIIKLENKNLNYQINYRLLKNEARLRELDSYQYALSNQLNDCTN